MLQLLWCPERSEGVVFAKMRTNIPERRPREIRSRLETQCIDELLVVRRRVAVP
jgi:hypothetical protein